MDVFIFRENTEDVYIGIEWKSGSPEAKKLLEFLNNDMLKDGKKQIDGIPAWVSSRFLQRNKRLVRRAIKYALANKKKSVTLVHKGNIQKFTEGGFRDWATNWRAKNFALRQSQSAKAGSSTIWTRIPRSPSSRTRP